MSIEFGEEWNNPVVEIVEHQPQQWHTYVERVTIEELDDDSEIHPVRGRIPIIEIPFEPIPMSEDELIRDYGPTIDENQTIEVRMSGYQAPVTPEVNVHVDDIVIENIPDFENSDRE